MSWENVALAVDGGLGVVTVQRPKALNALNAQTLNELFEVVEKIAADTSVRAFILTGSGEKAFVAGADIAEMADMSSEQARAFSARGHRVMSAIENLSIPSIAAVNGFALGGGCELALACDFIYASEKARFGLPEVGLGVVPGFGGTQRLARRIGLSRAKELIFTGDMIDAPTAKSLGLVLEVLAPEKLMEHAKAVAAKIASKGPLAIAQAKRCIEAGSDASRTTANQLEQQVFGHLFDSSDQKEGMKAFLEKRAPQFSGK